MAYLDHVLTQPYPIRIFRKTYPEAVVEVSNIFALMIWERAAILARLLNLTKAPRFILFMAE